MRLRSLLLAQGSFDHDIFIPVAPEVVLALLSRPQEWIRLQPLVIAIDEEPRAPGMLRITDRHTIGGLTFQARYRAQVIPVDGGLDGHAWSFPFIHVLNRYRWHAQEGGTLLRETTTIEAPRPLLGFTVKTARAAHVSLLANVKQALVERSGAR